MFDLSTIRLTRLLPLLILWMGGCGELTEYDARQVEEALQDSLLSTTESWNLEMELMEDQTRQMRLVGSYAVNRQETEISETTIDGPVHIQLFDSTGEVTSDVRSGRASYHPQVREFELFDSVRVVTANGRQLRSDYLHWRQDLDEISSDRTVIIITEQDSIRGTGFKGKSDLSSYVITDPSGRLEVE
ncbi:MAG: LPS export ABC transporter periplasmic protein LptC [Bacteroidota bacterium]